MNLYWARTAAGLYVSRGTNGYTVGKTASGEWFYEFGPGPGSSFEGIARTKKEAQEACAQHARSTT